MNRIALYRAWRPQSFLDVVGQQHITRTLQNSIKESKTTHAYLFSGPRGTGKTSTAKILAKAVNCERDPSSGPCNECEACRRITAGTVMDVVEIDAASNRGVEEIRDIRDKVKYAPTEVRRKVYIIDEVHMLTTEAFNALLKTLEEPPEHVMFILATTEPHKLPATIISRCQRFDFHPVPLAVQIEWLQEICRQEGLQADEDALHYIARLSDGGMRDALSVLDQISAFSGDHITYPDAVSITGGIPQEQFKQLAQAIQGRQIAPAVQLVEQFMREGKSADKCLENLMLYFRDLLMILMAPDAEGSHERLLDAESQRVLAESMGRDRLFLMIETLVRYQAEMKYVTQPQMLLEVAVMKLCTESDQQGKEQAQNNASPELAQEIHQLAAKLRKLEQQLEDVQKNGVAVNAGSSGSPAASESAKISRRNDSGPGSAGERSRPSPSTGKNRAALDIFKTESSPSVFKSIIGKWPSIMQTIKERKITVHAWLIDGEPVAATENALLIVFKSAMHRETTDKPANREVIEQVLAEAVEQPLRLVTAMQKDWQESRQVSPEPEVLELQPEPEESKKGYEQEWINEAIELFGEDLVKVVDE